HARAVRGNIDFLVDVGAVEHQRVGTVLTLNDVVAVARIPNERVVPGAELGNVVAAATDHRVAAVAADQQVGALAAGNGVVAGAAVDDEPDNARLQGAGIDRIVAGATVDDELVVCGFGTSDDHLLGKAIHHGRRAGPGDLDVVGLRGAVDGHLIGRAVALTGSRHSRKVDRDL